LKIKTALALGLVLVILLPTIITVKAPVTWSAPTMLSNNGFYTARPEMAQRDDGTLLLVYSSTRGTIVDIFSKVYTPSSGWSQEYKLTDTAIQDNAPSVAVLRNGTFVIVWAVSPTGPQDVHMARTDGTRIWGDTTIVNNSADDGLPSVAITQSGDIWVFWVRFGATGSGDVYRKTYAAGAWSPEQLVTTEGGHNLSPQAHVAKDGRVWVAWYRQNSGNDFEVYAKNNNAGVWSSSIRITQDNAYDSAPDITQDRNGAIWIFWSREFSMGGQQYQDELYSTFSSDNGATWPSANTARITNDAVNQEKDDREPAAVQGPDKKLWLAYMSDPKIGEDTVFQIYLVTSSVIPAQDLGVKSITASPSSAAVGATVTVTVDVRNFGDSQQTTTLNLYLKGASETLIGTRTVIIDAGQSSQQAFSLPTSSLAPGQYTFRATVTPATGETPANQGDNNVTDGSLLLSGARPQDVDGDGDVDLDDLILVYIHLFTNDLRYDVDFDGDVDIDDLISVYTRLFT